MVLRGISREGDQILAARESWSASLTILPVRGGPGRQLTEARPYNTPLGWSEDGRRVFFETELSGEGVMFYGPVAGGPMHEVKLPEPRMQGFAPVLSGEGEHVLYAVQEAGSELATLKVYSIEEDWSWELSRNFVPAGQMLLSGAGGTHYRDGDDFLYFEKREGDYVLVTSPPHGPAQLMRTFGVKLLGSVGVHGDRIAYIENSETEATLFLATAGKAAARRVLNLHGMLDMVVWSPGGRRLAAYHFDPARSTGNYWDPAGQDLTVLEVRPSGEIVGEPRRYSVPAGGWWNPRWLPDGQAVLVNGIDGNIWLIPLDPNARPVAITQDDPRGVWLYRLSPDGRYIAYPSERDLVTSIWLLKLKEPLIHDDD
jgi:Tol biopolymer transport system component